jgi:hyperosmotically inducible protein
MRLARKLFVLGVTLAGAISVPIAGCSQAEQSPPAASATIGTVIDDTVITAKVKSALLAEPDIKSFDLTLKGANATIGNTLDDGIITTKVKSALLADPNVKSFDIAVVTRTGAVQLSGFVDSQTQIDQAIALAHKVGGVTSVDNEMSVKK